MVLFYRGVEFFCLVCDEFWLDWYLFFDCFFDILFALNGLLLFIGGLIRDLKAAALDSELEEFVPLLVERLFFAFFADAGLLYCEIRLDSGCIEEFKELYLLL